ncbi:MAG: prenyltransferase [Flaviaesturariibacter sp.]|nr:prenyltransferase [Flaviaesturariibacter sp.]
MDRDETPIGGLEKPLAPTRQLFHVSIGMDVLAVLLSLFISWFFFAGIVIYILLSRAYSYRGIRLKQFPLIGFLTVFLCQGALIFFITYEACSTDHSLPAPLSLLIASLLIGALYPLTQIYQHEADLADGVQTISCRLGKRGTFIFSAIQFLFANVAFYFLSRQQGRLNQWWLFLVMLLPVVLFFLYWMSKVWRDGSAADFRHSLRMNILSTTCTTAFFMTLNLMNH